MKCLNSCCFPLLSVVSVVTQYLHEYWDVVPRSEQGKMIFRYLVCPVIGGILTMLATALFTPIFEEWFEVAEEPEGEFELEGEPDPQ